MAKIKAAQKKLALYRQALLKTAIEDALAADCHAARKARGEPVETYAERLARIHAEQTAQTRTRRPRGHRTRETA